MALGTYAGGWRIIKTMGTRIAKIDPPQGFAAQTACAGILWTTAHYGFPVSTTQTITGCVMGAGASRRFSAVRWGIAGNIAVAWILTLPAAAFVGATHGARDAHARRQPRRLPPRGRDRGRRVPRPALRDAAPRSRARVERDTPRRILTPRGALPIHNVVMATRIRTEPVETLLNRELSHLEFHARVLELATDETLPLLERVNYCGIFSSNLDEFFQVRVAGLLGQAEAGLAVRSADGLTPQQALARIRERVLELTALQSRLWKKELRPALELEGITVGGIEDLETKHSTSSRSASIARSTPCSRRWRWGRASRSRTSRDCRSRSGSSRRTPSSGEARFARVKIPEGLPRFFHLGGRGLYVPLEQIIAHFLPTLFPGVEILERAVFRVTRDADFEVSDDADDLLEAVESQLRRRRFGDVVRVEVSSSASSEMVARLQSGLEADETQTYRVDGLARPLRAQGARGDRPPGAEVRARGSRRSRLVSRAPRATCRRSSTRSVVATCSCTSRTARSARASRSSPRPPSAIRT